MHAPPDFRCRTSSRAALQESESDKGTDQSCSVVAKEIGRAGTARGGDVRILDCPDQSWTLEVISYYLTAD